MSKEKESSSSKILRNHYERKYSKHNDQKLLKEKNIVKYKIDKNNRIMDLHNALIGRDDAQNGAVRKAKEMIFTGDSLGKFITGATVGGSTILLASIGLFGMEPVDTTSELLRNTVMGGTYGGLAGIGTAVVRDLADKEDGLFANERYKADNYFREKYVNLQHAKLDAIDNELENRDLLNNNSSDDLIDDVNDTMEM